MIYCLKNNALSIQVNSFGAEICSVIGNETNIEYLWQANPQVWARHAPNLFPIVGKLKNGTYSYKNKVYQLLQHGFARDNEFICIKESDTVLVFELRSNEKLFEVYPFHFKLHIIYTLIENTVKVCYNLFNEDMDELFFSIGAHPAFNCPLNNSEAFEDYELIFPNKQSLIISTLNDGLISEQTKTIELKNNSLPVTKQLFDHDALVFINHQIDEVQLISKKTKHGISLKSANWPYFGIWTKKQTTQFICLEPWYGIADFEYATGDFVSKTGIMQLMPKQHFECDFEMTFM